MYVLLLSQEVIYLKISLFSLLTIRQNNKIIQSFPLIFFQSRTKKERIYFIFICVYLFRKLFERTTGENFWVLYKIFFSNFPVFYTQRGHLERIGKAERQSKANWKKGGGGKDKQKENFLEKYWEKAKKFLSVFDC